jgi:hypothetical protein
MLVGIDYSITSPAICLYDEKHKFCFENCSFYFLTNTKKFATKIAPNINGEGFEEYAHDTERFDTISEWATNLCMGAADVAIEGYSYGSHGRIFNLAENCGILKYKLHKLGVPVTVVEPSRVKKLATGKGNADKQAMYEAFLKETKTDLISVFDQKSLTNPVTDVIDSFYILKSLIQVKDSHQNL